MKRQELIQIIEKNGAVLIRHGGKHDWYKNKERAYLNLFHVTGK